ncbi:MAG: hypothetical protein PHE61_00410 [Candidatus Omnitrophica bacterium]|nr:hypothetical protein [Candidatus Omnitrophota bacterium]
MLNHIALEVSKKRQAEVFYSSILGLRKEREFVVSREIGERVFGIADDVPVIVFSGGGVTFEIFVTGRRKIVPYSHVCLNVTNRAELIKTCEASGISLTRLPKEGKELIFIRDFSGNLFEVKE